MYSDQIPSSSTEMGGEFFREKIRQLTQRRARKAKWLPDEEEGDEKAYFSQLGGEERRRQEALRAQQNQEDHARTMRKEAERNRWEANLRAEQLRQKNSKSSSAQGFSQNSKFGTPKSVPKPQYRPKRAYTKEDEESASVIQRNFRAHQSIQTVNRISAEFHALRNGFVYPSDVAFVLPGSKEDHVTVHTTRKASDEVEQVEETEGETAMEVDADGRQPKLAYTAVNYPIHSYVDAMEKLLMSLDAVESYGDTRVRDQRRSAVREIGKEATKLERYWKQVWKDEFGKKKEDVIDEEEREVQGQLQEKMDEDLVHIEHPSAVDDTEDWLDVTAGSDVDMRK